MSSDEQGPKETGDLLREQGHLTDQQLELVRRRQHRLNIPQHRAILDLNFASEEVTYRALATLSHLDFVDLANVTLPLALLEQVPLKVIFHYRMLPVAVEGDVLTLALSEPMRQVEQGNLRLLLGKRFKIVLATPSVIHALIKKHFGLGAETIQKLRDDRTTPDIGEELVFDVKGGEETSPADATIGQLVDQILIEALRLQATDIHLEPHLSAIHLRYRIDGLIQSVPVPAGLRPIYPALVSRLKIMAGLNIAEKRLPHDGRTAMKLQDQEYDLRVSIIPTKYGETVCLRILGRQSLLMDFAQLGMESRQEAVFSELTRLPQGLVLLTGPTGSGKTTTLYAALAQANDGVRKIITIEDPIEYQLEGITQIQVREDIGLTFAGGLRSILRHDPDVVLIGEIRDADTAETAVQAAQTGHLVFSTLHTNDSVSTFTRLLGMKIDSFLVSSSLVCSIAQRLARRICRHCIEEDEQVPELLRQEMAEALHIAPEEVRACKGRGCVECNQQGTRGRIALYEFFLVNDELADLIGPTTRTGELREAARKCGWRSLRQEGWVKVQSGVISVAEQQRLTRRISPGAML